MEFPLDFKPTSFSVGNPQFSSYWNPQSSPNFTIAGTPAGSFVDSGAAFQTYLNSNISPFSAFGNTGDAYGTVGGAGTDPYAGMSPDARGMLIYLERQQDKNKNWREEADYWFQKEEERANKALKMKERLSIPAYISQGFSNLSNTIVGGARTRAEIAADARRTIGEIQQQGIAYRPVAAELPTQRYFR